MFGCVTELVGLCTRQLRHHIFSTDPCYFIFSLLSMNSHTRQDAERVRQELYTNGFVVVPRVLAPHECKRFRRLVWDFMESATSTQDTPMCRKTPATWKTYHSSLNPLQEMHLKYFGVAQSRAAWCIRQHPCVKQVFARLWQTKNLAASFEGISFLPSPEFTKRGWRVEQEEDRFHTSQAYSRNSLELYEGFVTGETIEHSDATMVFIKGSHRHHEEFASRFKMETHKHDWHNLTVEQIDWFAGELGLERVSVKCPEGSMILWDSRTTRAYSKPHRGRQKAGRLLFGASVCMAPASGVAVDHQIVRRRAFKAKRATTSNPHRPVLFSKPSEKDSFRVAYPQLTNSGARLAGFESRLEYEVTKKAWESREQYS